MIPVNRPDTNRNEIIAFLKGHFGDYIPVLEKKFADYIGDKYGIFTSSCRSSLYITYKNLKLEGDVLVSPLTCSIAILPIICAGLKPHFVDIDPLTYNIDPEKINESITKDTCAIQVIHLAGNPCDMKSIMEIAEDHSLLVIEDCAQSLGAEYNRKRVGIFGNVSCFSFTKNMFSIGGGMITTNDKNFAIKINDFQQRLPNCQASLEYYRFLRDNIERMRGSNLGDKIFESILYFKRMKKLINDEGCEFLKSNRFIYNPNNVEAAISLSQFQSLDNMINKRANNALLLTRNLEKLENIKVQKTTNNSKHVYTKYIIETEYNCVDIIKELFGKKIEAKHLSHKHDEYYQERLDRNLLYSHYRSIKKCVNYCKIHDNILSLPISSNMKKNEIPFIINKFTEIIENKNQKTNNLY